MSTVQEIAFAFFFSYLKVDFNCCVNFTCVANGREFTGFTCVNKIRGDVWTVYVNIKSWKLSTFYFYVSRLYIVWGPSPHGKWFRERCSVLFLFYHPRIPALREIHGDHSRTKKYGRFVQWLSLHLLPAHQLGDFYNTKKSVMYEMEITLVLLL